MFPKYGPDQACNRLKGRGTHNPLYFIESAEPAESAVLRQRKVQPKGRDAECEEWTRKLSWEAGVEYLGSFEPIVQGYCMQIYLENISICR